MPVHLNYDLDRLKKDILEYSAAIDQSFARAVKALEGIDSPLAKQVIKHDKELDRTEVEIEDKCLKILALHQPVARDLRFVVAVLKMNNDLERIGDFAVNIAKRTIFLSNHNPIVVPPAIFQAAALARSMVSRSLSALIESDSDLARAICVEDDVVDKLAVDLYQEIQVAFRNEPDHIPEWMQIFSVIRYVERVADLATNIAEDVVYLVEGEVVRHQHLEDEEFE
ncbi:phosphate signaling complex protein PhoU [bacterium]|nr:phosphate signaling complex protein PhoU [bacterium]MBU1638322.1 phosphate signaling complex protein PhoU [bacterium]MBU1921191.1 phosphate signaling complex protein PhoU [bacterium]